MDFLALGSVLLVHGPARLASTVSALDFLYMDSTPSVRSLAWSGSIPSIRSSIHVGLAFSLCGLGHLEFTLFALDCVQLGSLLLLQGSS